MTKQTYINPIIKSVTALIYSHILAINV